MAQGFWQKLKKPIFALAPMANVTDAAFRRVIAEHAKPDVMWTEFVSVHGLSSLGREKLLPDLWFTEPERPIVAQFFGVDPKMFYECAQLAAELGFDGIDINMGCPAPEVGKQGAGAALIKDPKLAQKIIFETKRGAGKLPVSVKTRIGYLTNTLQTWLPQLLETEPAAITLHLRTKKEMSKVPAHWEVLPEVMEIVGRYSNPDNKPLILGNGDCHTLADAKKKVEEYGVDGVMIGRGIFGNPWLFDHSGREISTTERLEAMIAHTKLFCELYKIDPQTGRGIKDLNTMKKHYKAYANGFDGAKELRGRLMEAENVEEIETIAREWLAENI